MMKVSKVIALVATALGACVFGICGCSEGGEKQTSLDTVQVYELYVLNETAAGNDSPLSYEDWLSSIKGEKGDKGDKGEKGESGANGLNGVDGKSAYQIWLEAGNSGTVEDFIAALKGEKGDKGESGASGKDGLNGVDGKDGANGKNGQDGVDGVDGKSAYQIWLDAGNVGTEEDFIAALKGEKGEKGDKGEKGESGANGKDGINGTDGKDGVNGANGKDGVNGVDGKSAYQIWLDAGNVGTEEDFIAALKGSKGDKGDVGLRGEKGEKGENGESGEDGNDGVSVLNVYVNDDTHLIVELSNGVKIDAGYVGVDVEVPVESRVYSVIFMADGVIVGTAEYEAGDTSVTEPAVPTKSGYTGAWASYTLSNKNIVVNAVYTKISEQPEPSDPDQVNPDDFVSEEEYVIKVTSAGGLALSGIKISALHSSGTALASGITDSNGTVKLGLIDGEYVIEADVSTLPSGYYLSDTEYKTNGSDRSNIDYVIPSAVFTQTLEDGFTYEIGDIARDFTVTAFGDAPTEITLSEVLKTKTAVVLVFFDPNGATSKQQMAIFESVYLQNGNVQLLGVYASVDESKVSAFLNDYSSSNYGDDMTMPLVKDTANLSDYFEVGQYPTTVVIDRYGMVAYKTTNTTNDSAATALINKYTSQNYVQKIED